MRRVHVLAAAGAVALLASCSGNPNDLRDNRYYRDAEAPEPTARLGQSQVSPNEAPRPAAAPAPTTRRKPATALDRFALTATDLASEGVRQTGAGEWTVLTTLPDCNVSLGVAESGYQTAWAYPSGATLKQSLAEYPDAAEVVGSVAGKPTCGKYKSDGAEVTVSMPVTATDGQVSWCATSAKQSACTVLQTDGSLLSVVVVIAATETKAKQAVTRIAPLAATALRRNS